MGNSHVSGDASETTMNPDRSESDISLSRFDDLFRGHPAEIEKNLGALLPRAQALDDQSIALQILSQIALAQAMQQRFVEAHQTLDRAEAGLGPGQELARVRIVLERGRVFHQADDATTALPLFLESFELSRRAGFDFLAINAAHMVAIVAVEITDKIRWNRTAIELAETSRDDRARAWLGALYNNLAHFQIEAGQYPEALEAYQICQRHGEERGDPIVVRGARWGVGRALRSLGRLDEALGIQRAILEEYRSIALSTELPAELLAVGRGMVYEELAEIHLAQARGFSSLAYEDLASNAWFVRLEPERLEKLKAQGRSGG